MSGILIEIASEFRRHKLLADKSLAALKGDLFFARPAPQVNSAAIIVKHLAGNLRSRWTDFLATDGEKPDRQRDQEFVIGSETRAELLSAWEQGWSALFTTLDGLQDDDLTRSVLIRGEAHTVLQALLRALSHATYHVGQILYLSRMYAPDAEWLTIAPGQSQQPRPGYLTAGPAQSTPGKR